MKNFMQKNLSNAPKVVKQPTPRKFAGHLVKRETAETAAVPACLLAGRCQSVKPGHWRMTSIQLEHSHRVAAEHFFFVHFG
jgi:hypothetical protein